MGKDAYLDISTGSDRFDEIPMNVIVYPRNTGLQFPSSIDRLGAQFQLDRRRALEEAGEEQIEALD